MQISTDGKRLMTSAGPLKVSIVTSVPYVLSVLVTQYMYRLYMMSDTYCVIDLMILERYTSLSIGAIVYIVIIYLLFTNIQNNHIISPAIITRYESRHQIWRLSLSLILCESTVFAATATLGALVSGILTCETFCNWSQVTGTHFGSVAAFFEQDMYSEGLTGKYIVQDTVISSYSAGRIIVGYFLNYLIVFLIVGIFSRVVSLVSTNSWISIIVVVSILVIDSFVGPLFVGALSLDYRIMFSGGIYETRLIVGLLIFVFLAIVDRYLQLRQDFC